jgi:Cu/Ag efflux pump CusA
VNLNLLKGSRALILIGGGEFRNAPHSRSNPTCNAFGITATDVAAALKRQNVKKPAGRLTGEEREFTVTTTASSDNA